MANLQGNNKDNTIRGTNTHDEIEGKGGDDQLFGRGGNDDIEGDAGNDKLYGGKGSDNLEGGRGDDWLDGGKGFNNLEGGSGADTFVFRGGVTRIDDFEVGIDHIRIDDALGVDTFRELKSMADNIGDSVVIDFGKHQLVLDDVQVSDLKASDFDFF